MAIVVYEVQLVETNAHSSQSLGFSIDYILRIAIGFIVLWVVLPNQYEFPSDYLLFIYGLFTLAPFIVFGQVSGDVYQYYFIGLMVISTPLIFVRILKRVKLKIKIIPLLSDRYVVYGLLIFALVSVAISFIFAPASSGFTLGDSYTRRLEGREAYIAGSFLAYAIGMTVNGITPYLAFTAGLGNRKLFLLYPVAIALIFFYLVGTKGPIAYVFLSFVIGSLSRLRSLDKIPLMFFVVMTSVFTISAVELLVNDYSLVAEFSFRRANVVPGQVVSHYLEMMFNSNYWSSVSGVEYSRGATYLIGEIYYTKESNVNTNAFVYSLAAGGFTGYIAITFLVALFYFVIDNVYSRTRNQAFIYIGFFYGLLIAEQAAPTALVSSGFALLTILFLLENRQTGSFLHGNQMLKVGGNVKRK
jgi:hypothetical protein